MSGDNAQWIPNISVMKTWKPLNNVPSQPYDNISVHISENVSSKTTLNVIFMKNNWQLTQWQIIYATADVTS